MRTTLQRLAHQYQLRVAQRRAGETPGRGQHQRLSLRAGLHAGHAIGGAAQHSGELVDHALGEVARAGGLQQRRAGPHHPFQATAAEMGQLQLLARMQCVGDERQ